MSGTVEIMIGCEPISHRADSGIGVVLLHGFTGNPWSMRGVADAMITAGYDVELPRLPGHGTTIADMIDTEWADWLGEVERAIADTGRRTDRTVLVGQSMGGTLALAAALDHPELAALALINPATRPRDLAMLEMIDDFLADGMQIVPGEGSDIADPESSDIAYDGTPLRAVRSLLVDGVAPISDRFAELTMPLRLFTSRHDHVVDPGDSEHLAATYGGPVVHSWLERSYHVATLDFDRDFLLAETAEFVAGQMPESGA